MSHAPRRATAEGDANSDSPQLVNDALETVDEFTALVFGWFFKRQLEVSPGKIIQFRCQGGKSTISRQQPDDIDFFCASQARV